MKEASSSPLSGRYLAALKEHVGRNGAPGSDVPQELGRAALAAGLETLGLAKLHDRALAALLLPTRSLASRRNMTRRAEAFFAEAILPIEKTHGTALQAVAEGDQLHARLRERTQDLADSNRELQRQIAARKTSESAFKNRALASSQLLKDSLALEQNLHSIARKILSTTEDERKKMYSQLSDEIVQTLLGIKLRMMALKKVLATNDENRTKEIAKIQRLVKNSTVVVNRLAHEFSA